MRNAAIAMILVILPAIVEARGDSDQPRSFEFAETELGNFDLEAYTRIRWDSGLAWPEETFCSGGSEEINFTVNQLGGIESLSFQFNFAFEGETDKAIIDDTLWLYIDGERLEYVRVPSVDRRFANVEYPSVEPPDVILPVWKGWLKVRTQPGAPLIPIDSVYEDIVRAEKLEWSFKTLSPYRRDLPSTDELLAKRFQIDIADFAEAIEWCRHQVASEAALTLPEQYRASE